MKYSILRTSKFKKDYKQVLKRGLDQNEFIKVLEMLANNEVLPAKYRDHSLSGNYIGHRECHIQPDWLLIYYKTEEELVLTLVRTGSHSDLF